MKHLLFALFFAFIGSLLAGNCPVRYRAIALETYAEGHTAAYITQPKPPKPSFSAKQLLLRSWVWLGVAAAAFWLLLLSASFGGQIILWILGIAAAALLLYALIAAFRYGIKALRLSKKTEHKRKGWMPTILSGIGLSVILAGILVFMYVIIATALDGGWFL